MRILSRLILMICLLMTGVPVAPVMAGQSGCSVTDSCDVDANSSSCCGCNGCGGGLVVPQSCCDVPLSSESHAAHLHLASDSSQTHEESADESAPTESCPCSSQDCNCRVSSPVLAILSLPTEAVSPAESLISLGDEQLSPRVERPLLPPPKSLV